MLKGFKDIEEKQIPNCMKNLKNQLKEEVTTLNNTITEKN